MEDSPNEKCVFHTFYTHWEHLQDVFQDRPSFVKTKNKTKQKLWGD